MKNSEEKKSANAVIINNSLERIVILQVNPGYEHSCGEFAEMSEAFYRSKGGTGLLLNMLEIQLQNSVRRTGIKVLKYISGL